MENFYEINTESRYFVPLRPCHNYGFVSIICDSDEPHMIECKLEPYKFSGFNYKLYAVPVDPIQREVFSRECYYTSDFRSLVQSGYIVEKTSDDMKVVPMRAMEHLYGNAYLIHDFETIIGG